MSNTLPNTGQNISANSTVAGMTGAKKSTMGKTTDYSKLYEGVTAGVQGLGAVGTDLYNIKNAFNPQFITPPQQNFNGINSYQDLSRMTPQLMDAAVMQKIGFGEAFIDSQFVNAAKGASAFSGLGPWGMLGGATGGNIASLVKTFGHNMVGVPQYQEQVKNFNTNTMNQYQSNMDNSLDVLNETNMRNRQVNLHAFGGEINAPVGNSFTEFNSGGGHSENPLGGIPQGFGSNGKPNLVEEGEVKFNNYIFSNRLIADAEILSKVSLPEKYANNSFAEVAKAIQLEAKERPNDPISSKGSKVLLERLQQAQETVKLFKAAGEAGVTPDEYLTMQAQQQQMQGQAQPQQFAFGGNLFADGGDPTDPPITPRDGVNRGAIQTATLEDIKIYNKSITEDHVKELVAKYIFDTYRADPSEQKQINFDQYINNLSSESDRAILKNLGQQTLDTYRTEYWHNDRSGSTPVYKNTSSSEFQNFWKNMSDTPAGNVVRKVLLNPVTIAGSNFIPGVGPYISKGLMGLSTLDQYGMGVSIPEIAETALQTTILGGIPGQAGINEVPKGNTVATPPKTSTFKSPLGNKVNIPKINTFKPGTWPSFSSAPNWVKTAMVAGSSATAFTGVDIAANQYQAYVNAPIEERKRQDRILKSQSEDLIKQYNKAEAEGNTSEMNRLSKEIISRKHIYANPEFEFNSSTLEVANRVTGETPTTSKTSTTNSNDVKLYKEFPNQVSLSDRPTDNSVVDSQPRSGGSRSYSSSPRTSNYTPIDYTDDSDVTKEYLSRYNSLKTDEDWNKLYAEWELANPKRKFGVEKFKALANDNMYGPVHEFIKGYNTKPAETTSTEIPTTPTDTPEVDNKLTGAGQSTNNIVDDTEQSNPSMWKDDLMYFNPFSMAPIFNSIKNVVDQEGADPTFASSVRNAYQTVDYKNFGQQAETTPFDWRTALTAQRAKDRANQAAIMNISGGNPAAASANLAVNNLARQGDIAASYRQGVEYNNANRMSVLGFNNSLDQANKMSQMQIDQYNNTNYMKSIMESAQIWDAEKKLIEQTKSVNQNALASNMGNFGNAMTGWNLIRNNPNFLYTPLSQQLKGQNQGQSQGTNFNVKPNTVNQMNNAVNKGAAYNYTTDPLYQEVLKPDFNFLQNPYQYRNN